MKTKITHLTSAHLRYDARIFSKICVSLSQQQNFEINLIVADGEGNKIKEGVNIIDVGKKEGGRLLRMTRTVGKVYAKAKELDSVIYHFHDPELIPIGLKLKKLGKKVIFDIHENTDLQILEKEWIPFLFRKIISVAYSKYENYACKKFDALLVPQVAMKKKFEKFSKTGLIGNFPNCMKNEKEYSSKLDKFNLIYSGSISSARGLWNIVGLSEELKKLNSKYQITIAGLIDNRLLEEVQVDQRWKNIRYLGFLDKELIYREYNENSIGLILFNNVGQYYMAYSLKLFEYMQNGMYIIMPNFGDWITFNQEYNVGLNVDTHDYKSIALEIDSLNQLELEDYFNRNKKNVNEFFSWESQELKLFNIYKEIIEC